MERYGTDLTDEQWALVSRLLPSAKQGGRPRSTDPRQVLNAILYLVKTGCHWRLLPLDFPPWRTVYGYFVSWGKCGILRKVHRTLYYLARRDAGRSRRPSILIIDSQSVKTTKMGGERGFDGGKRVKGRKRHLVVDSLGLPLCVTVTAANVHDLTGGKRVLKAVNAFLRKPKIRTLYADGAYAAASFKEWVGNKFSATVRIAANLAQKVKAFVPVSQRWVVERTFAWMYDFRRLVVDYERLTRTSKFMMRMAAIYLILNRLSPRDEMLWE